MKFPINTFTVIDATTEADVQNQNIPLYKLTNVPYTISDIRPFQNGWEDSELIWVDKNANDKWSVLQNTRPGNSGIKTTAAATADDKVGSSVAINSKPKFSSSWSTEQGSGAVIPMLEAKVDPLLESNPVVSTIGDSVDSFGSAVGAGTDYVAIGAPDTESSKGAVFVYYIDATGTFNRRPTLRPSGLTTSAKYGTSIAMSGNGRYLFVGASGENKIYSKYTLVTIPTSSLTVKTITGNRTSRNICIRIYNQLV